MEFEINIAATQNILNSCKNNKIEKEKLDEILKMEEKFIEYYENCRFTNDTDLEILKKIQ